MTSDRSAKPAAGVAPTQTQAGRMRAAIDQAVVTGIDFQRGKVDAHTMAHAMTGAVQGFVEQEKAAGGDGVPQNDEALHLSHALMELNACGSGFLAGRCDAA